MLYPVDNSNISTVFLFLTEENPSTHKRKVAAASSGAESVGYRLRCGKCESDLSPEPGERTARSNHVYVIKS